jgi:integrase
MRGDGFVFQRGKRWWIGYYRDGAFHREAVGTSKTAAKDRLKEVRRQIFQGNYQTPAERRMTVSDLLEALRLHLTNKGLRSIRKVTSHMQAMLKAPIAALRAAALTTADVERYQQDRLELGRKPATVNREIELLREAYRRGAAVRPRLVVEVPLIPLLKVDNARQGFLSRADFEALAAELVDVDVRDFVEWFWWTGMRPGEIRQLTWGMLDQETWTLNLDPRAAKTGKGRAIAVAGPLRTIIDRRLKARRLDTRLIFHRTSRGRPGQPVLDFMKARKAALKAAHLPAELLPYDLRRSAIRNLVRAGVDATVVKRISGHRTDQTFARYNIMSVDDVRDAIRRREAYEAQLPTSRNVVGLEPSQKAHNRGRRGSRRGN